MILNKWPLLCILLSSMAAAMELEHKPSAIELLPDETKVHIFDYLDYAPTIEQAVQNIQNTARVNQDFSRLLNDQFLTKKFIDRLIKNFPEQTRKEWILGSLYLNTAGSRIWLDKNHRPEFLKEYAKNLAKEILDGLIAEPNDAPILNALLNVPGIADYIKNYKNHKGGTALMMTAFRGHITVVEKLLAAGAQPNMKDKDGTTALMLAASRGHSSVIEKLLAAGADSNITNNKGMNPLIIVALVGRTAIAERLLAAGADPTFKNKYGRTALDHARHHGHVAVIKLLESHMKKAIS